MSQATGTAPTTERTKAILVFTFSPSGPGVILVWVDTFIETAAPAAVVPE